MKKNIILLYSIINLLCIINVPQVLAEGVYHPINITSEYEIYDAVTSDTGIYLSAKYKDQLVNIDEKGNTITPFTKNGLFVFNNGYMKITKDNKCGVINSKGDLILPIIYDDIWQEYDERLELRLDDKCGIYQILENFIIEPEYDEVSWLCDGLVLVEKEGKYGYVDTSGKVAIPIQYSFADDFSEGLAQASINNIYGYINTKGEYKIPPKYSWGDSMDFHDGLALIRNGKGKIGYLDTSGKIVIPFIYDEPRWNNGLIGEFDHGLAGVEIGGKKGIIDTTGTEILPIIYDYIGKMHNGRALVAIGNKCGFINENGNIVIPLIYNWTESEFDDNALWLKKDKKWGAINKNGEIIVPFESDRYRYFFHSASIFEKNGKYGSIDDKGNEVIPFIYDKLTRSYEFPHNSYKNTFIAKKYDRMGLVDINNQVVIPFEYDKITYYKDLYILKKNGKYEYVKHTDLYSKISVCVNQKPLKDALPIIQDDHTLVPLRSIFEALGADVLWIEETQSIIAKKNNIVITLQIGNHEIVNNGTLTTLDSAPMLMNNKTYVPLRAVAEGFGADVTWHEDLQSISILY